MLGAGDRLTGSPARECLSSSLFRHCQMWGGIVTKGGAGLCSFVGGYDLPID